jgi:hypothetical protein
MVAQGGGLGQDCFENIKTAAVEELATLVDSVIEREDLQTCLQRGKASTLL